MKFSLFLGAIMLLLGANASAQTNDCNKLGAWLWYIEITGFQKHSQIADTLKALGVKRIYVKVADGTPNTNIWPELIDSNLVKTYKSRGLQVWGWSYNYPNNPTAQAQALYQAAKTGYQGYVVDVEAEFDNAPTALGNLFTAFAAEKNKALAEKLIDTTFKLYCTTWGNPKDHNFKINLINPHVDAFMPQTYVEVWGSSYMDKLEFWIDEGNKEYKELGCTKPIHHIAALETGKMTAEQLNRFVAKSGPQTSIWRIPGGSVPTSLWGTWGKVNWRKNFCPPLSNDEPDARAALLSIAPNPTQGMASVLLNSAQGLLRILDINGRVIFEQNIDNQLDALQINLADQPSGIYYLQLSQQHKISRSLVVKTD